MAVEAQTQTAPLIDRLLRERDLYLRLLDLGGQSEVEPFLREALVLIAEMAGAAQGYLELQDEESADTPRWSTSHGFSAQQVEGVRAAISRGIIAEALASGRSIVTASALLDARFSARESVQLGQIAQVLCTPIGQDPPVGVVYLQGRWEPGPFSDEDRAKNETVARHLVPLAERLLARRRQRERDDATLPLRKALRLEGVVGRTPALAAMLREVAQVAPLDVSVLLTGESGTGKSQIARVIHDNGPRAGGPFIEVNCGALPETLIESELFGSLRGAHSMATRPMEGKVAAAEGGTLLLDEVADLPLAAQGKLLHLLQSKHYFPLGGTKPVQADIRLIAATNTDLETAVRERRFREDLFYRLQVLPLRVPSLAERRGDIPELAAFFCALACRRHGFRWLELSPEAVRAAESAVWPGNVRHLAHFVEAAAIRAASAGATCVERAHLFPERTGGAADVADPTGVTFQEATRRFQAKLLRDHLEETGWHVSEVARRLDLARSHVYNLIHAFGLERGR